MSKKCILKLGSNHFYAELENYNEVCPVCKEPTDYIITLFKTNKYNEPVVSYINCYSCDFLNDFDEKVWGKYGFCL